MADAPKRKRLEKVRQEPQPVGNQKFYCSRCGTAFSRQKGFFPVSHSPMYRGTGHLPFCNDCVEDMYDGYRRTLGDDREALRRMCMKLDLYWSDSIYSMVERTAGVQSRVRSYIGKTNIIRYIDKTFDDTLTEEERMASVAPAVADEVPVQQEAPPTPEPEPEIVHEEPEIDVAPEIVAFWGTGFTPYTYLELESKYKGWTEGLGAMDPAEQAIYKQICILETTINRDSTLGKPIDKHVNALNTLLGSANLKPAQRKTEEADTELDNMPFGVGIRKWENTRPIPEPDPELQDVDGIVRYISVWFLGHLCKMVGIKNTYCRLYEEEMERLRVKTPEFEDEDDDETLFNDIFGGEAGGDSG